ncbi:hypothetical protein ACVIRO_005857 [Rhizobium ruizarguesonis]
MVEDRNIIRKRKWLATVRGIVTHSAGGPEVLRKSHWTASSLIAKIADGSP